MPPLLSNYNHGPPTGDREIGCYFLPRKFSSGEWGCSCSLSLGICFLTFMVTSNSTKRRIEEEQEPKC